jgi:hypothetical protein
MWDTTDDSDYRDLRSSVDEPPFRIVFAPHSLAWTQVDELRSAMNDACGEINSPDYRANPANHFWCPARPADRDELSLSEEVDYVYAVVGDDDMDPSEFDVSED